MADEIKAPDSTPAVAKPQGGKWWHLVLFGLLMFAVAVFLYFDLTKFEQEGGTRRMHALLVLIYNLCGKWGVVGLVSLLGAGFFWLGIRQKLSKPS